MKSRWASDTPQRGQYNILIDHRPDRDHVGITIESVAEAVAVGPAMRVAPRVDLRADRLAFFEKGRRLGVSFFHCDI
jgi:hypothetical protein